MSILWKRLCRRGLIRGGTAAAFGVLAFASAGLADCSPEWLPGGSVPGFANSTVRAKIYSTATWDPDGPGGQEAVLVAAGSFGYASDVAARNIAVWDGASWSPLGDGLGSATEAVNAVTIYDGQLIAAGSFTSSGATSLGRIARWNGSAWVPLGSAPIKDLNNGQAFALAVYDNNLVVGGSFTQVESANDNFKRIAQWNGSVWSAVSSTATQGMNNGSVRALAVYDSNLVAGGDFTQVDSASNNFLRIAQWNGSSWLAVSNAAIPGMSNGSVNAFAQYDGNLVAGGSFTRVESATDNFRRLAQWNGTAWSGVGATATPGLSGGVNSSVNAMTIYNGELVVAGNFTQVDGAAAISSHLVSWNGSAWTYFSTYIDTTLNALLVDQSDLIVAGDFVEIRPAESRLYALARWDGSAWSGFFDPATVTDNTVWALAALDNGNVAAGGGFRYIEGLKADYLAEITGDFGAGSVIGDGLFRSPLVSPGLDIGILSIADADGHVYAGGYEVSPTDGASPVLFAETSGAAWSSPTPPLVTINIGGGLYFGVIETMITMPDTGDVIAGGLFFFPNDTTTRQLARWDGFTWTPMMNETITDRVYALAVLPNGDLIAAGTLSLIGGAPGTNNIVRWNGDDFYEDGTPIWERMGYGTNTNGKVETLQYMPSTGELLVGGTFSSVGNDAPGDLPARGVARWNVANEEWVAAGQGLSRGAQNGHASAMTLDANGDVIVGGYFTSAGNTTPGDVPANYIARWDGASWSTLGVGVDASVTSLATTADGTVVVGGSFTTAGGKISPHLARWACTGAVCAADFNNVNGVTVQDIFDFLTAWLAGNASADFNGVNGVTVQDIFDFLTAWLAGC